jgi:hypothetical protein
MSRGVSNPWDIRLAPSEPSKLEIFIFPFKKSVQNKFPEIQSTDRLLMDDVVAVMTVLVSTKD